FCENKSVEIVEVSTKQHLSRGSKPFIKTREASDIFIVAVPSLSEKTSDANKNIGAEQSCPPTNFFSNKYRIGTSFCFEAGPGNFRPTYRTMRHPPTCPYKRERMQPWFAKRRVIRNHGSCGNVKTELRYLSRNRAETLVIVSKTELPNLIILNHPTLNRHELFTSWIYSSSSRTTDLSQSDGSDSGDDNLNEGLLNEGNALLTNFSADKTSSARNIQRQFPPLLETGPPANGCLSVYSNKRCASYLQASPDKSRFKRTDKPALNLMTVSPSGSQRLLMSLLPKKRCHNSGTRQKIDESAPISWISLEQQNRDYWLRPSAPPGERKNNSDRPT
ncbi:unnamed protein product, partial [Nesidiocoris tenuis]